MEAETNYKIITLWFL